MGKIVRRAADRAQPMRQTFQTAFLLLNLWIGARFYLFVRYCETGGQSVGVTRPPGIEGWLPIAGLMNLKYFAVTGRVPDLLAAGFFLLVAFTATSLLFRKAFCSWLCPIGTLSEWLWQGGRELMGRNLQLPRWLDIPLRSLKYLIFGFFGYAVLTMGADEIAGFLASPYGAIADVKLLNFFREIGPTGALVTFVLVLGSVFVKNLWCRYLCPYGALMGIVALFSPARILRDPASCIDCDKCTKACPSFIPVASLRSVKTPECTGCLECVTACPVSGALDLRVVLPRRRWPLPAWAVAAGVAALFVLVVGYAKATGHWDDALPMQVYFELVPASSAVGHPGEN